MRRQPRFRMAGSGRRGRVVAALAVAAVAALGAGCAGSPEGRAAGGGACTGPGVSDNDVKVGLLYPVSGPNATGYAPYRAGFDARLGVANASGGVYGRKVTYAWADDEENQQGNLVAAQRLVRQDQVFGVVELTSSSQGSAAWLNREGVPVVGTSVDLVWAKYRNMFSYNNLITTAGSISTWGDYARDQGARKAAILFTENSDSSRLLGAKFQHSMAAAGIATRMIEANPKVADKAAIIDAIRASGADMITGFVDPQLFVTIAAQARQVIPGLKILSASGYDQAILILGKQLAGMSVFVDFAPFERRVPAHDAFIKAMATYAPQQQPAADQISLEGWIDGDMMLRGLEAAGSCPTRAGFITKFRDVKGYTAGGLLAAPVDMQEIFGKLNVCYSFVQIASTGDRFVPVGDRPRCGHRLE